MLDRLFSISEWLTSRLQVFFYKIVIPIKTIYFLIKGPHSIRSLDSS